MKDFNAILETAIKFSSSVLVKDSIEILKLKSSASSSLDEFCLRSLVRFYEIIHSKLNFFSDEYSFLFLGKFPEIDKLNAKFQNFKVNSKIAGKFNAKNKENSQEITSQDSENQKEKLRRFVINVDGFNIFSVGLPNYSISVCVQEKNFSNQFETQVAFVFSPCDNRFFCAEKEKGLTLNKVKFKRSSISRNYSILATGPNLAEKFNKYYNLIYLKNFNLGLIYLATGSVDLFLAKIQDKREILAGLFIAQVCAIPAKITRLDECFKIEAGVGNIL